MPRGSNCSRPVNGGTLVVAAPKDVKARTEGRVTIRTDYDTLDGNRQSTRELNLILFPTASSSGNAAPSEGAKP